MACRRTRTTWFAVLVECQKVCCPALHFSWDVPQQHAKPVICHRQFACGAVIVLGHKDCLEDACLKLLPWSAAHVITLTVTQPGGIATAEDACSSPHVATHTHIRCITQGQHPAGSQCYCCLAVQGSTHPADRLRECCCRLPLSCQEVSNGPAAPKLQEEDAQHPTHFEVLIAVLTTVVRLIVLCRERS
jgi:hypothetical protein